MDKRSPMIVTYTTIGSKAKIEAIGTREIWVGWSQLLVFREYSSGNSHKIYDRQLR